MKRFLPFMIGLFFWTGTEAQRNYGNLFGYVQERKVNVIEHLYGAVVQVAVAGDTLYTTTSTGNGSGGSDFFFPKVPLGKAFVRITFLGYEPWQDTVEIRRGDNGPIWATMKPAVKAIDEVVVEGEAQLFTRSGDTLIYNAAAVRTMEGDETMRILEQLPGVMTDEFGRVTILGQQLERTYINGRLIYGSDPMAALNSLLAKEVTKLKVYDEMVDEDRRRGAKFGKKRRVLDIQTREPIVSAIDGHFLASYGADFNKDIDGRRRQRYGAGLTANFYSEMLLLSANAFVNNVNRTSNRLQDLVSAAGPRSSYDENKYVEIGMDKYWRDRMDGNSMSAGYSYDNRYSRSASRSVRDYFATEDNPAMQYYDTTRNVTRNATHTAYLDFDFQQTPLRSIRWQNLFSHTGGQDDARRYMMNRRGQGDERSAVASASKSKNYRIYERVDWANNQSKSGIFYPRISFEADIAESDRTGWRIDTLSSTAAKKVLESDYIGPSRKYGGEAAAAVYLNNTKRATVVFNSSYGVEYQRYRRRQASYNLYDEPSPDYPLDTANTYDYTYDYLTHQVTAGFNVSRSRIRFQAEVRGRFASMGHDERFPASAVRDRNFNAWLPFALFSYNKRGMPLLSLRYMTSNTLPSVEQLRDRIDDNNPLLLRGGNPGLSQAYVHDVQFNFNGLPSPKGNVFRLTVTAKFVENDIAQRSLYFREATRLPGWNNYLAPAGSMLNTFENVNGNASVDTRAIYMRRLKAVKSVLEAQLCFQYNRQPSYNGGLRNEVKSYTPYLSLVLRGTFSRNARINLYSTTSYSYGRNRLNDDTKLLGEGFSATGDFSFLKRWFLNARYDFSMYRFFSNTGTDTDTHILNLVFGCKVLKGMGGVSVAVYDLLNRGTGYRSAMYSNYVEQSWTPSFGRYFTFNLSYRFNKTQSGKAFRGELKDGSVRSWN